MRYSRVLVLCLATYLYLLFLCCVVVGGVNALKKAVREQHITLPDCGVLICSERRTREEGKNVYYLVTYTKNWRRSKSPKAWLSGLSSPRMAPTASSLEAVASASSSSDKRRSKAERLLTNKYQ